MVDPVSDDDLAPFEPQDRRAGEPFDPFVAPVDHGVQRVFVFQEDLAGLAADPGGHDGFEHPGDFRVALHEFYDRPARRIRRGDVVLHQVEERLVLLPVVGRDLGQHGLVGNVAVRHLDDLRNELPDADILRGDH